MGLALLAPHPFTQCVCKAHTLTPGQRDPENAVKEADPSLKATVVSPRVRPLSRR